jgi:D-alanine-D-alanine ligase
MSRKLNVTVLVDNVEIPPNDPEFNGNPDKPITEYHVIQTLRSLDHSVTILGATDVGGIAKSLTENRPDIVFNLTEQLGGDRRFDKNIAALLELLAIPFTGTGSTGLMLARDKRLCKELLSLHKIRIPNFISLPLGRKSRIPKTLRYPLVVKPAFEDSSEGISNVSLVYNETSLQERAQFIHERWKQPAIAEEYIEGRELYASILGNKRLMVFPIRECFFEHNGDNSPVLLTYRVKWNEQYRRKWNINFGFAELEPSVLNNINRVCKKVYRILQIRDYGRIDLRLTADNKIVILEANPNPDLAYGEEVADAAEKAGISYDQLIDRILHLALRRYE